MTETGRSRQWAIMLTLMIGVFLSPLNVTLTSVALPTVRADLGLGIEAATWVSTAYFIPSVAFMPLQASLGERWGMRRVYALGLFLLAAGSLASALARSYGWLLASRVVQGIGWSALYPLALVLIRVHFSPVRQGEMMGVFESAIGVGTIVAPLLGGALIAAFSWPSVFVVLSAIALLGGLLGLIAIPAQARDASPRPVDWTGGALFTLLVITSLVGVARRDPVFLAVALVVGLLWLAQSRRRASPFVRPALFGHGRYLAASAAASIRMMVAVAVLTALPLFFEEVQGLTPTAVGAVMVIYSAFLFLGSWPGGRWADRAGVGAPGLAGFAAMIAGTALLLTFDLRFSLPLVGLALAVRGLGAGLTQAPYAKAAVEAVPPDLTRMASGVYGTLRYGGLALGTTLVGVLLQTRLAAYGAPNGGPAALPAYRELWLVLTGIISLGLVATWLLARGERAAAAVGAGG